MALEFHSLFPPPAMSEEEHFDQGFSLNLNLVQLRRGCDDIVGFRAPRPSSRIGTRFVSSRWSDACSL
jgi:hypothetical protein